MDKIKKIVSITIATFIFVIVPFVVFTLITSKTDAIAHVRSFVVLTGSMQPTIPAGSIIFTQKSQSYQKDDVISYQKGNVIVTHRVIDARATNNALHYQTKGDANNTADSELVAQKDVLGKSVFFVPYVGKFVLFLKTFPGYALLIIFPTVFFIVFELNNIRKEIIRHAEKKAMEKMQVA